MSKPVGKFINLSEDWELNYCLKNMIILKVRRIEKN